VRLIIEKIDGVVYAYRMSESHFNVVVDTSRFASPEVNPELLDWECNLSGYDDFRMVFHVKKGAKNG
jgi:thiamine monophosphate kinase